MVSDISSSQINSSRSVLDWKTFIDGAGVAAAIADVEYDSCSQSASVQTQHAGRMEEKLGYLEVLKEHLRRSDSVSDGVIGRFC